MDLRGGLLSGGRGCVSHMFVDVMGLLVREILCWERLSSVRGPRVLTGQLQGNLLEHDGALGVLGLS